MFSQFTEANTIFIEDPFVATDAQLGTARAFARAGYRETGFSYGCLVLRDRHGDDIHINELGRVVPAYLR